MVWLCLPKLNLSLNEKKPQALFLGLRHIMENILRTYIQMETAGFCLGLSIPFHVLKAKDGSVVLVLEIQKLKFNYGLA